MVIFQYQEKIPNRYLYRHAHVTIHSKKAQYNFSTSIIRVNGICIQLIIFDQKYYYTAGGVYFSAQFNVRIHFCQSLMIP
jgi:hypothetical protein